MLRTVFVALTLVLLWGCQTLPQRTLYDEIGGMPVIEKIVDNYIEEISFDPHIVRFFMETDIDRLREKLTEQLCNLSGGPCEYTGDSMKDSHAGMHITEAEFNRFVDLLINAMNKAGVAHRTQNKLLALLTPMRDDIMYH